MGLEGLGYRVRNIVVLCLRMPLGQGYGYGLQLGLFSHGTFEANISHPAYGP